MLLVESREIVHRLVNPTSEQDRESHKRNEDAGANPKSREALAEVIIESVQPVNAALNEAGHCGATVLLEPRHGQGRCFVSGVDGVCS